MKAARENPAPWWFLLLARWFPERCREIPEAVNPDRIVLRQFALWKRYAYLQQFASSEDARFMHSHQWAFTIAIGLWGHYTEQRIAGRSRVRKAPYLYTMDAGVVHHVQHPSRGHTSIFIGLFRDDDLKHYYGAPQPSIQAVEVRDPYTRRVLWSDHIRQLVKRI